MLQSTQLVKAIITLLVELLPTFSAESPPISDSEQCLARVVDPNHSVCLLASYLIKLTLRMIVTKTSAKTEMSSSCQKRLR